MFEFDEFKKDDKQIMHLQAIQPNLRSLSIIDMPFDYSQYGYLVIAQADRKHVIDMQDILYVKSDNNYATIVLSNKKILVSKTLKWVSEKLDKRFMRIHNSYIVNLLQIAVFTHGRSQIKLNNEEELPVARSKKKILDSVLR